MRILLDVNGFSISNENLMVQLNDIRHAWLLRDFISVPASIFFETFSPVVKPVTIRIILTLAISANSKIKQLDISNAFLHGDLKVPFYMSQPPGFVDSTSPRHVCLLHKSLYSLRQVPREWYIALSSTLLSFGFVQSRANNSLFTYNHANVRLLVLVYVDDLIVTGSSSFYIEKLIQYLKLKFAVKDLGALSFFLGVEVVHCKEGLFPSQHKYLVDLL